MACVRPRTNMDKKGINLHISTCHDVLHHYITDYSTIS